MKKFFAQDKPIVGIVAGLGSEVAFCIALTIGLLIAGEPVMAHVRWFGGMFIPLILVLHHYAVTKTLIVILFVTFLAFMIFILKTKALVLQ